MNPGNYICISCLCNVCKCGKKEWASYSYKGRLPAQSASKKEWAQFIELFLSYDPLLKKAALESLNDK